MQYGQEMNAESSWYLQMLLTGLLLS